MRQNYTYDNNSYNYKAIRREENLILCKKMNAERRIKVENVNLDEKTKRFSIELARKICRTVGGETIT